MKAQTHDALDQLIQFTNWTTTNRVRYFLIIALINGWHSPLALLCPVFIRYIFIIYWLLVMRTRTGRIWEELFCLLSEISQIWQLPKAYSFWDADSQFFFIFFYFFFTSELLNELSQLISWWFIDDRLPNYLCKCSEVVDISKEDKTTSDGVWNNLKMSCDAMLNWCYFMT